MVYFEVKFSLPEYRKQGEVIMGRIRTKRFENEDVAVGFADSVRTTYGIVHEVATVREHRTIHG